VRRRRRRRRRRRWWWWWRRRENLWEEDRHSGYLHTRRKNSGEKHVSAKSMLNDCKKASAWPLRERPVHVEYDMYVRSLSLVTSDTSFFDRKDKHKT